jgi:hypothetical protein
VDNERAIEKTCQTLRKKRNNTGSINSSNAMDLKRQNRFWANHVNMSNFSVKSSSLFSASLSCIKSPHAYSQLNGNTTKELTPTKFLETSIEEQNSKVDLSVHNDVILANLQQYYRDKHEWSTLDDHISQCLNDIHKSPSNNQVKTVNFEEMESDLQDGFIHNKRNFVQEQNEFDDGVLNLFMDLERDNTIENDITSSGDDNIELFLNEVLV